MQKEANSDELLTYEQAAAVLGVPKATLIYWTFKKRVPHYRLGARTVRFRRADLEDWLRQRCNVSSAEGGEA